MTVQGTLKAIRRDVRIVTWMVAALHLLLMAILLEI